MGGERACWKRENPSIGVTGEDVLAKADCGQI